MDVIELFKNALYYPTKDLNKLLILGVFFIIMGIFNILQVFGISAVNYIGADIVLIISSVLTIVIGLIINGYGLSITKETIFNSEELPEFNWGKNIVDGLKIVILYIVYYIIPFLITIILGYATGAFEYIYQIMSYSVMYGSAAIPQSLAYSAFGSIMGAALVGIILFIIFTLLLEIAMAKLAETDNLGAAINMKDVFNEIGNIGWGNYIIWIILLIIISIIIGFVGAFIQFIPFIGFIIVLLVFTPYIRIFSSRALGLIYNERN